MSLNTLTNIQDGKNAHLNIGCDTINGDAGTFETMTVTTLTATNIINPTFSDSILSVGGAVVANTLPEYADTTGLLAQSSGIASASVFLTDGSRPMNSNLDMNGNSVNNVNNITSIQYTSNGPLLINGIDTSGFGTEGIALGVHGSEAKVNGLASCPIAIGKNAEASSNDSMCFGNGSSSGFNNSTAMGTNVATTDINSAVIGNTLYTYIRTDSAVCNLGTSVFPFKDIYLKGLRLARGANQTSGSGATLSGSGTVTVNNSAVNTGDIVLLSCTAAGGTQGIPRISAIVDGVSLILPLIHG